MRIPPLISAYDDYQYIIVIHHANLLPVKPAQHTLNITGSSVAMIEGVAVSACQDFCSFSVQLFFAKYASLSRLLVTLGAKTH